MVSLRAKLKVWNRLTFVYIYYIICQYVDVYVSLNECYYNVDVRISVSDDYGL